MKHPLAIYPKTYLKLPWSQVWYRVLLLMAVSMLLQAGFAVENQTAELVQDPEEISDSGDEKFLVGLGLGSHQLNDPILGESSLLMVSGEINAELLESPVMAHVALNIGIGDAGGYDLELMAVDFGLRYYSGKDNDVIGYAGLGVSFANFKVTRPTYGLFGKNGEETFDSCSGLGPFVDAGLMLKVGRLSYLNIGAEYRVLDLTGDDTNNEYDLGGMRYTVSLLFRH